MDTITYGDTLYILGALVGIVELTSYLAIKYVIHKLPRKLSIFWHYIICIALCAGFFTFGVSLMKKLSKNPIKAGNATNKP